MIDDDPAKFNLMALRSFSESFYHAVTDSALENGYQGLWYLIKCFIFLLYE